MTDPTPSPAAPKWKPLEPIARRVLGVLIEKAKTTPAGYPMSVNAIVTGCNQKNNREPAMSLEDLEVERGLEALRTLGAASEIDWLGRVAKWKHHAYEWMGVNRGELAVMTELLLRGAQAMGELRGRAARMEPIEDLAALKPIVDGLVQRGLLIELSPAGRGQLVSHNLYLAEELAELKSQVAGHAPRATSFAEEAEDSDPAAAPPDVRPASPTRAIVESSPRGTPSDSVAELSARVSELREELARLRERVSNLESRPS
jgi:uncharacterized protein YceH (UPF0502 family)